MKKPPKPTKPSPQVPAWTCPKCGTTHPITVRECCKGRPLAPLPKYPSPLDYLRYPWQRPDVICKCRSRP